MKINDWLMLNHQVTTREHFLDFSFRICFLYHIAPGTMTEVCPGIDMLVANKFLGYDVLPLSRRSTGQMLCEPSTQDF
ncbi:MAG: hypothetical protein QOI53_563 [Verrucomicrobiota bacterium]|jgi:hypothetical protein|nr:hypothetical protein [Verrucomicrobiota bacterium]